MHKCRVPGCEWEGKTAGALTLHTSKQHKSDPLAGLRNSIPGSPRAGGAFSEKPLRASPSGIPSIDFAIGIGGLPNGSITEIFGPSQSGKTFTALTFSAFAQMRGGRAGYMNAERAPMQTFLPLIPGLDAAALEYGEPPEDEDPRSIWDGTGEATLEASRRFIESRAYDIWTIDSVHALTPRQALNLPIGSKQADAALARMLSDAIRVLDHVVARTDTVCIFVNHVKSIPQAPRYGRKWSKPGGSALDYYSSVQLHVSTGQSYLRKDGRRIGHVVKVRVHKLKVGLPHATAEYDLFYGSGVLREDGREVQAGIDITSSWMSVLKEAGELNWVGNSYYDGEGNQLGREREIREALQDPRSALSMRARTLVYPEMYGHAAGNAVAV